LKVDDGLHELFSKTFVADRFDPGDLTGEGRKAVAEILVAHTGTIACPKTTLRGGVFAPAARRSDSRSPGRVHGRCVG
jgi:hypothetical protein